MSQYKDAHVGDVDQFIIARETVVTVEWFEIVDVTGELDRTSWHKLVGEDGEILEIVQTFYSRSYGYHGAQGYPIDFLLDSREDGIVIDRPMEMEFFNQCPDRTIDDHGMLVDLYDKICC